MIALLEADGWVLKRTTGSHRHYSHPTKPGLVTIAGKPSAKLKPRHRIEHPETSRLGEGTLMRGYVVVFEGDEESGYSAYAPDLPGVVAAAADRAETEQFMREAMAEHIAILRETGQAVPEPAEAAGVTILDPAAA